MLGPGRARVTIFLNSDGYGEQSILHVEAEVNQIIALRRVPNNVDFLISCTDSCGLEKTAAGIREPAVSPSALHSLSPRPRLPRRSYDEETWGPDRP
jgi:hypothetical protein